MKSQKSKIFGTQKICKTNFFVSKNGVLSLEYIIVLIILSIILILVLVAFLGPKIGLFNYFSNFVGTVKKWIPGKESIEVKELIAPEKLDRFFDDFEATLESAVGPNEKCLIKYEKIDDFEGFRVELTNIDKNLVLRKINKDDQVLQPQITIENINICRIEPQIFFNNYLGEEPCTDNCEKDFIIENSMTLTTDNLNEEFGLEDGGLLYKPKKDKVCFIPTHKTGVTWYKAIWQVFTRWGCEPSKEGTLDNNCIKQIKEKIDLCTKT